MYLLLLSVSGVSEQRGTPPVEVSGQRHWFFLLPVRLKDQIQLTQDLEARAIAREAKVLALGPRLAVL